MLTARTRPLSRGRAFRENMADNALEKIAYELFHAFDIRIDAERLTDETASRLCNAQAWYFRECLGTDEIVLCRDTRKKGEHFLQLAIDTFSAMGFRVYTNVLPVSTCQFYFSCMQRPSCAGIMYTASHNPKNYTGQKTVGPNVRPVAENVGPEGGLTAVRDAFLKGKTVSAKEGGSVTVIDDGDAYVRACLDLARIGKDELSGISVVADFLSGSAGSEVMRAFRYAGISCVPRNVVPDGNFPSGAPNPIIKENIEGTLDYIRAHPSSVDFCFLFDGDGDRVDTRSGDGTEISPSVIMTFLSSVLTSIVPHTGEARIGIDSKASPVVHAELKSGGNNPLLVPNGHSQIKDILLQKKAIVAVEETAHYYLNFPNGENTVPMESTLLFCLLFLKRWKNHRDEFDALVARQNSVLREREWGYTYSDEKDRDDALCATENFFTERGYVALKTLEDGSPLGTTLLKRDWDGDKWCWIAQRASQSEKGVARWMVTSSDADELQLAVAAINDAAQKKLRS